MGVYLAVNGRALNLETGQYADAFVPGVTKPFYEITQDFTGQKNVGAPAIADLEPYTGTKHADGYYVLGTGTYEGVYFDAPVDCAGKVTMGDSVVMAQADYVNTAGIKMLARVQNGGSANTGTSFTRCEFHNRAQRPLNGIMGRNFYFDQSVITGVIDGFSDATAGTAPQDFGFVVTDTIIPSLAFWYSDPANSDIHSDRGSHSDSIQKFTTLQSSIDNSVLLAYVDEIIGTGTPGSGRDAGNTYVPPSGTDFTASQSQMEAWRSSFTTFSTASQSYGGVSHRTLGGGVQGSFAAVMVNVDALDISNCILDGGTVTINAASTSLATTVDMSITDTVFYNGMTNGHGADPATKGHAILLSGTTRTFQTFSGNEWFDGVPITRQTEGGFTIYR